MEKTISPEKSESAGSYITEALNLIKDMGGSFDQISANLTDLKNRLDEGRFHLAVLG